MKQKFHLVETKVSSGRNKSFVRTIQAKPLQKVSGSFVEVSFFMHSVERNGRNMKETNYIRTNQIILR